MSGLLCTFLLKEQSISDENVVEGSDVLSAISNEECSVTSEILDKNSSGNSQSQSHLHAAEIIQVKSIDKFLKFAQFNCENKII